MFLDDAMRAAERAAAERMRRLSQRELSRRAEKAAGVPSFVGAVRRRDGGPEIIAEVKRMSPSAGSIRAGAGVAGTVRRYEDGGAAAVSVITSAFAFAGSLADLAEARSACSLPLLRKDFLGSEYQLLEARTLGASAVLLIADALEEWRLEGLIAFAGSLGLDALVESHSRSALEKALETGASILGINNRDLRTLEVDLETTGRLLPMVPEGRIVVSESGVRSEDDIARLSGMGVDAVLVGEELMRSERPAERLRVLKAAGERVARPEREGRPCG